MVGVLPSRCEARFKASGIHVIIVIVIVIVIGGRKARFILFVNGCSRGLLFRTLLLLVGLTLRGINFNGWRVGIVCWVIVKRFVMSNHVFIEVGRARGF